jgi:hypothetical protein
MAPAFSKTPVAAILGIPVLSGLICSHEGCNALFSSMDDAEAHARADHGGKIAANTCGIYERTLGNGQIKLYRVLDDSEDGEPMISLDEINTHPK